MNYLRKIDPFVFEELLLEGFEAHGFRTIRNKRYTGDGGIDGQVIIGK
ncbi:restriction endonuclease, partial [Enterobacter hormaechei]